MSLTKISSPQLISPSNNPIPIVYSSTNAGTDGFRYNVLLKDGSSNTIIDIMIYPDSSNSNYLVFDFSMILSDKLDTLSYNDYYSESIVEKDGGLYTYNWEVTEYIGTTSGVSSTGTESYVFKGVVQYDIYWDYEEYLLKGINRKFLSNRLERNYKLDEYGTIDMFYGTYEYTTISEGYMKIKVFSHDGQSTYYFDNYPSSGKVRGIWTIPIGPKQINQMAIDGKIETSGGVPTTGEILNPVTYIDPTIKYEISYTNSSKVVMSETITINLDIECHKQEPVEFLYLGELGTYETFSARFSNLKSYSNSSSEIKSNQNRVIDGMYYHNVGDRGRKVVNKRTQESHKVLTGWMNNNEVIDLMELFNSTDVYVLKDSNTYPIIITNTSYKERTIENDRLFNYEISYDMAYQKLSNR